MRGCPVCECYKRENVWKMEYKIPYSWPLPTSITWYTCSICGMLYGDGPFAQSMLDEYYRKYYGYGVNSVQVSERLVDIAKWIYERYGQRVAFTDFGGSGDDGKSIACEWLKEHDCQYVTNVNAGENIPPAQDVILCSHVLEHIYEMPEAIGKIIDALKPDGLLIVDGPDSTGLLLDWRMPMLDFNTKHINHFRMIDYLHLFDRYGFELVDSVRYEDIRASQTAKCIRLYFRRISTALASRDYVTENIRHMMTKLQEITEPVNVWGLGDIAWHLLARVELDVLSYIDNDPAYRGAIYAGKPVLERPDNDAPILIMAQGQKAKLIENIRKMGIQNRIIEVVI